MDGQSARKCATSSPFASTLTKTDPDLAAATSPGSANAEAAAQAEGQKPCDRFQVYPGKA